MTNRRRLIIFGVLTLCAAIAAGPASAKNPKAKQAEEEIEFGYKAAKRGYWQEALERFVMADRLTPNQPRILNNIAVALEANGRFDEARLAYEAGMALDPSNSALRRNHDRFVEFYATYVAVKEEPVDEDDDEASTGDDTGEGGDDAG